MLNCFNVISLGQYNHQLTEEGHVIMCHQKEEVINAYIAREKEIMKVLMDDRVNIVVHEHLQFFSEVYYGSNVQEAEEVVCPSWARGSSSDSD